MLKGTGALLTPSICIPPLWAKAELPTYGSCPLKVILAISAIFRLCRLDSSSVLPNTAVIPFQLKVGEDRAAGIATPFPETDVGALDMGGLLATAMTSWPPPAHTSLWVWIDLGLELSRYSLDDLATSDGKQPPLVSQRTRQSAPPSTAACKVWRA